jgi:hypothetical protein
MSLLVVSWEDTRGVEYNATALFDPESGRMYIWDGKLARYVESEQVQQTIDGRELQ